MNRNYKQCELSKVVEGSTRLQTAWLPSKFAVVGKYVELKGEDGTWDNGWKVDAVFNTITEKEAVQKAYQYKNQREATDI
jgi:hypothetical protein